jgi:hypothetical protein
MNEENVDKKKSNNRFTSPVLLYFHDIKLQNLLAYKFV